MDDLLADFLTETNESLADLDVALVKLEQTPDDAATLQLIFRLVHTIKGTCGFLGLPRLERVAHAAENVLGRVRDKVLPVTPDLVTAVLSAIDRIKLIIAGIAATESEPEGDDSALTATLEAVSEARGGCHRPARGATAPGAGSCRSARPGAAATARCRTRGRGERRQPDDPRRRRRA